ncbi:DUF3558 domain-containing protein [Crossiella sp. CA198]|uniref:DUF3558 domain-containing protein n=1 Tax=Crossiella sp. CA198 TaxID=3455607 RepID=UPI003F8D3CCB
MRKPLLGLIAALTVLLAGCGGGQAPATSGTSEPAPGTSSSASKSDLPPINNPRKAEDFLAKPCELLSTAQLTELGIALTPPGKPTDSTVGVKSCTWRASGQGITVGVSDKNTFEHIHKVNKDKPSFSLAQVDGYPSIRIKSEGGLGCDAWVGVSAARMIVVFDTASESVLRGRDVCEHAQQVAGAAIKNLPQAG